MPTPPTEGDYDAELRFVTEMVRGAAELAVGRSRSVTPHEKANHSFVTDLDRDLEILIRERLAAIEGYSAQASAQHRAAGTGLRHPHRLEREVRLWCADRLVHEHGTGRSDAGLCDA